MRFMYDEDCYQPCRECEKRARMAGHTHCRLCSGCGFCVGCTAHDAAVLQQESWQGSMAQRFGRETA